MWSASYGDRDVRDMDVCGVPHMDVYGMPHMEIDMDMYDICMEIDM